VCNSSLLVTTFADCGAGTCWIRLFTFSTDAYGRSSERGWDGWSALAPFDLSKAKHRATSANYHADVAFGLSWNNTHWNLFAFTSADWTIGFGTWVGLQTRRLETARKPNE